MADGIAEYLEKLSQTQRVIVGVTLSFLILVVFAHNPFSGYMISSTYTYTENVALEPCSEDDKNWYRQFLTDFYNSGVYDGEQGKYERRLIELSGGVEKVISTKINRCHLLKPGLPTDTSHNKEYRTKTTALPFNKWESKAPIIQWFGRVARFLFVVLSLLLICAVFTLLVFPKRKEYRD